MPDCSSSLSCAGFLDGPLSLTIPPLCPRPASLLSRRLPPSAAPGTSHTAASARRRSEISVGVPARRSPCAPRARFGERQDSVHPRKDRRNRQGGAPRLPDCPPVPRIALRQTSLGA